MDILPPFLQNISKYGLANAKVLLAVSGGLDSVVLCELCKQAGLSFDIAHCNFSLRREESERDEAFVRTLEEKYGEAVFVKKFDTDTYATEKGISIQEAARNLRYEWFEELRTQHNFKATLLAHHADDNIETLLMNFFRGTGLEGLTGMPEQKGEAHCIRPMLGLRRKDIEGFAKEHGLVWVEDSSNESNKYTRNYFRNGVLPQLRKAYPQVEENLLNNINRFRQTALLHQQLVAAIKKKIMLPKGDEVHIPVLKLLRYKDTSLIYEVIKDFGFGETAVNEVLKLAEAESGKYITNGRYRIIKNRKWFIISPVTLTAGTFVIDKEDELILFGTAQLRLSRKKIEKVVVDKSENIAQLDAREIEFPLILRKWKTGDYFYPLGMRKKKKLARFFIDQKLSKTDKEKVWVVESHKRIVWIVGLRIDDRFKLTPTTKEVLLLTLQHQTGA